MVVKDTIRLKKIPISDLRPDPDNPRVDLKPGDPEYERIKASITGFGLVDPIILDSKTLLVIGGHQRLNVLIEQGITELYLLPLGGITWAFSSLDLKPLTDAQKKALNVALNNLKGEWEFEKLIKVLNDLKEAGLDFTITGFSEDQLDSMNADFAIPGSEREFDENCAADVKTVKCPECGHEFPI
jgi:ParB-like chromosome segregation protein Spo0J